MDRVILFNKKIVNNLIKFDFFRTRIDTQINCNYQNINQSKNTLYPKKFGMFNIIKKIEKILNNSNIEVHLNTSINSFLIKQNNIKEIDISSESNNQRIKNISKIIWTVPLFD